MWSEQETKLLFVERPAYAGRRLLAPVAGALSFIVTAGLVIAASAALGVALGLPESVKDFTAVVAVVLGLAAACATIAALVPKRHVTFYRDESKGSRSCAWSRMPSFSSSLPPIP